jgi:hypothetical protein
MNKNVLKNNKGSSFFVAHRTTSMARISHERRSPHRQCFRPSLSQFGFCKGHPRKTTSKEGHKEEAEAPEVIVAVAAAGAFLVNINNSLSISNSHNTISNSNSPMLHRINNQYKSNEYDSQEYAFIYSNGRKRWRRLGYVQ